MKAKHFKQRSTHDLEENKNLGNYSNHIHETQEHSKEVGEKFPDPNTEREVQTELDNNPDDVVHIVGLRPSGPKA